ncbi:MAG TPA: nuclear transport factor 2 family protein [Rectinemataceae bacterium]|nr:nuclear transport factor 2 family protein [Rectinemataceae bacterium]
MTQAEVVSRQLELYNAHDLEGFCSCYSDTVELRNMDEARATVSSKDELRETYGKKFSNPALKATIANRIIKGNYVIDHEKVEGVGDRLLEVVAIYKVEDDLIQSVLFIRD